MATIKQRKALDELVGNGGNITKAMVDAGYSPNTANTPQKLTESKGFIELCDERGLTEDLLVEALVEDIKAKKKNRKAELELGFKVRGRLKDNEEPHREPPRPILNVFIHNGNQASNPDDETPPNSSGGNVSLEDSKHSPLLDTLSPERQNPDANERSK